MSVTQILRSPALQKLKAGDTAHKAAQALNKVMPGKGTELLNRINQINKQNTGTVNPVKVQPTIFNEKPYYPSQSQTVPVSVSPVTSTEDTTNSAAPDNVTTGSPLFKLLPVGLGIAALLFLPKILKSL